MTRVGRFRPSLFVFDQRFGQRGACFLGLIRTNHHPLRTTDQHSEAELRAVHAESLKDAGDTLVLEQPLDHLRLGLVLGVGGLDKLAALIVALLWHRLIGYVGPGRLTLTAQGLHTSKRPFPKR
jgi:hypothetical protein